MKKIVYCPKCGTEQLPGSKFCQTCGTPTVEQMTDDGFGGGTGFNNSYNQPWNDQPSWMNQNQQMGQPAWMNQNQQMDQPSWMNQNQQPDQSSWMNQNQQPDQSSWMSQNQQPDQPAWMNQQPDQPSWMSENSQPEQNSWSQGSGRVPSGNNGNKKIILIAAICSLVVVIAVVVCIIVFGGKTDDKEQKSSGTSAANTTEAAVDNKKTAEADKSKDHTDEITEKSSTGVDIKESNIDDKASTEESSTEKTTEKKATTEKATESNEDAVYSADDVQNGAIDYCMYAYDFDNVSAKVKKEKGGAYTVKVSVTIDGNTGDIGSMSIDGTTGRGTGCRGEKVDLFGGKSDYVDIHYIIPNSDSRMLSDSDLQGITRNDLTLARNEIYARHGRMFKDDDIRAYFESQAWYAGIVPADQFSDSVLSKIEKTNISTIKAYEDYLDGDGDYGHDYNNNAGNSSYSDGDYIIPDSSSRYLTESDLAGLNDRALMLARNEIYARHGRKFNDSEIRAYFEGKSWYYPTIDAADFSEDMLSEVEKYNIAFIKSHED